MLQKEREIVESITGRMVDPRQDASVVGQSQDDRLRVLAVRSARVDKLETICAGVKAIPGMEPWRLLHNAASAGHVPSMVRFAAAFPVDEQAFFSDFDGVRAFRDKAPVFTRRAAAAGDARAAFLMMLAHRGKLGRLSSTGRFPYDPGVSLAYALALEGIGDVDSQAYLSKSIGELRGELDLAGQAKAQLRAAQLGPQLATSSRGVDLRTWHNTADGSECGEPARGNDAEAEPDPPIAPVEGKT